MRFCCRDSKDCQEDRLGDGGITCKNYKRDVFTVNHTTGIQEEKESLCQPTPYSIEILLCDK